MTHGMRDFSQETYMKNKHCPKCYKKVSQDEDNIYLCPACNLYFAEEDYEHLRRKYLHINTKGMSITEDESRLRMIYRWEKNYFLLFFSLFWCYVSFSFFGSTFEHFVEHWPSTSFRVVYPLLGVVLLYWALATFLNSTSVVVTQNSIRVLCSPLPWMGVHKNYVVRNIEQLYVEKYVAYHQNKTPVHRYKIVLRERKLNLDLIRGIEVYEIAVTLENYMERYLDIQDKPVDGEHKKQ